MSNGTVLAPVSVSQERLWFLDRLSPGSAAYNVPAVVPISGPADDARVRDALRRLVDRHGALRTTFAEVEGVPMQRIAEQLVIDLPLVDLRRAGQQERQAALHALCRDEASTPFDLTSGPLIRARLVHLTENRHLLLLTLHHICADAWSLGILLRDFAALFAEGEKADLPPLPLAFADFVWTQREYLRGPRYDESMAYWRKQLQGAPALLALPFDRPRPAVKTFAGALRSFVVASDVSAAIRRLASRHRATPFMVLLAAFNLLLARYSGSTDIVVGTPVANRTRPELESLVGFIANTLALRTQLDGDPTFLALLGRVKATALAAYEHQDVPFEKLVAELQPSRARDHGPIFQVFFALQNTPTLGNAAGNPAGEDLIDPDSVYSTAKFDLALLMGETDDAFVGSFEYTTDLFDVRTIDGTLASFQTLLRSIITAPELPISKLALLDAKRQQEILTASCPAALAAPARMHDLPAVWAQRAPDAVALRSGEVTLSYAELDRAADGLARTLRSHGVGRSVRAGVMMPRTPAAFIALLAVLKAGAAVVPLDMQLPVERLRFMATDAGLGCILREPGTGQFLDGLPARVVDCTESLWRDLAPEAPFAAEPTPDDVAFVIYTSGSTGVPKGIAMPHGPFCNMLAETLRGSNLNMPVTLSFAAWGFDVFLQETFSTWAAGGTLVIDSDEARRDPILLLRLLRSQAIARLFLPPVALYQLAEAAATHALPTPALKEIIVGGEALRITAALRHWISGLPGCRLLNHYGPSESHVITEHWLEPTPADWPTLPPIGKPLPGSAVLLLDESLELVPDGVPAEIYIGRQLSQGYVNRPDLNAERFRMASFAPGLRLYRTGDQARRRSDGAIEFLGRLDRQVKIRGYRVEPGEIDAVLASHPSVQAAATVVPKEDSAPRLVSYVVPKKQGGFDPAHVRRFLARKLAHYMMPAAFVVVEQLPVTPNGKLDVAALPLPGPTREISDVPYIEPRDSAEAALAAMWEDLLRVARIGIHDDFFRLGGHSLLAVRLVSRIRDHFGVELSVANVFETPTIAGQANRILAEQLSLEDRGEVESMLSRVEDMSETEARKALGG
jgi:amino acid adenylation domain-containing protein